MTNHQDPSAFASGWRAGTIGSVLMLLTSVPALAATYGDNFVAVGQLEPSSSTFPAAGNSTGKRSGIEQIRAPAGHGDLGIVYFGEGVRLGPPVHGWGGPR